MIAWEAFCIYVTCKATIILGIVLFSGTLSFYEMAPEKANCIAVSAGPLGTSWPATPVACGSRRASARHRHLDSEIRGCPGQRRVRETGRKPGQQGAIRPGILGNSQLLARARITERVQTALDAGWQSLRIIPRFPAGWDS